MPIYLSEARWDAAQPLGEVLATLDDIVQRTGGQVNQVLQVDGGSGLAFSLTVEVPDDLSLFRITREASQLGLEMTSRVALSRDEAEALDSAHRDRNE